MKCDQCEKDVPKTQFCINCGAPILYKEPVMAPLEPMCKNGVPISRRGISPNCLQCTFQRVVLTEEDPDAEDDYYICIMEWKQ